MLDFFLSCVGVIVRESGIESLWNLVRILVGEAMRVFPVRYIP